MAQNKQKNSRTFLDFKKEWFVNVCYRFAFLFISQVLVLF